MLGRLKRSRHSAVTVVQKPVAPYHMQFTWELSCLLVLILNVTPEMTSLTNLKPADEQIHIFALFPVFTRDWVTSRSRSTMFPSSGPRSFIGFFVLQDAEKRVWPVRNAKLVDPDDANSRPQQMGYIMECCRLPILILVWPCQATFQFAEFRRGFARKCLFYYYNLMG